MDPKALQEFIAPPSRHSGDRGGDDEAATTSPAASRKTQRRLVSAWIGTAFAEADAPAAHTQWRRVADQLRPKVPKLAELMDAAEHDVLTYMDFPREHRAKLHSTNPIERLNDEIKRRTDVVGIFPNGAAISRLIGLAAVPQACWKSPMNGPLSAHAT